MKKIILSLLILVSWNLFFLGSQSLKAQDIPELSLDDISNENNNSFFKEIVKFNQLNESWNEEIINLEVIQEAIARKSNLLEKSKKDLEIIQKDIIKLEENTSEEKLLELKEKQNSFVTLNKNIRKIEKEVISQKEKNKEQEKLIIEKIQKIEEEIEKQKLRIKNQAIQYLNKILIAFGILVFFWGLKKLFEYFIRRIGKKLTVKRIEFLLFIMRFVINITSIFIILIIFFSQLIKILPYLAILGTIIAFAIRDIVVSFIAWFVIGTKEGYRIGHFVKIDGIFGQVSDITPINTVLSKAGISGWSGQSVTIPNKKILETSIENWSKYSNFIFLNWDFFVEPKTDIETLTKILKKSMQHSQKRYKENLLDAVPSLKRMGLVDQDFKPQVFLEPDPRGIMIRAKLLVDFDYYLQVRTEVTQNFMERTRKSRNLKFKFVNVDTSL